MHAWLQQCQGVHRKSLTITVRCDSSKNRLNAPQTTSKCMHAQQTLQVCLHCEGDLDNFILLPRRALSQCTISDPQTVQTVCCTLHTRRCINCCIRIAMQSLHVHVRQLHTMSYIIIYMYIYNLHQCLCMYISFYVILFHTGSLYIIMHCVTSDVAGKLSIFRKVDCQFHTMMYLLSHFRHSHKEIKRWHS